jgi:hypothetical protein
MGDLVPAVALPHVEITQPLTHAPNDRSLTRSPSTRTRRSPERP